LKISLQSCWTSWFQKLKSSLLQKHVTTFVSVDVLATVKVVSSKPEQFIAFDWMKILQRATNVEQTIMKRSMIKIAKRTLEILLHQVISKLSQLIYYGSVTLEFFIFNCIFLNLWSWGISLTQQQQRPWMQHSWKRLEIMKWF
jgi:hypothetical protein